MSQVLTCPDCGYSFTELVRSCPQCGKRFTWAEFAPDPKRWPKQLQIVGAVAALLAAPLLAVNLTLWFLAVLPGVTLFAIGRIADR